MRKLYLALAVLAAPFPAAAAPEAGRAAHRQPAPVQAPAQGQPAQAQQAQPQQAAAPKLPAIRADIATARDILALGDLVSGLPPALAMQPAFRAPALGETGTIQTHRIVQLLREQGVEAVLDSGMAQVVVTREARRIGLPEVDAAVKRAIEERFGVEARAFSVQLDNGAPAIVVEPELKGALQVQDLAFDPRSRRLNATLALPGSAQLRLRPIRVTGQLVETVEVVVPIRTLNRGEVLQATDITLERRPREGLGAEFVTDPIGVIGKAARRSLSQGQALRNADLQRHEVIARNEIVTVVFETPGLVLTMRGRAQEAGAQGDVISVQNIQSRKILQATVLGPGRVAATPSAAGRVASAN